jgi:predicted transposase YdaD
MRSDAQLHIIFRTIPGAFFEMLQLPVPEGVTCSSKAVKTLTRTADAVFEPADRTSDMWVVEFETNPNLDAVLRAQLEVAVLQQDAYPQMVRGAVIYMNSVPDACEKFPWIKTYKLSELIKNLPLDHPLRRVLSPLLVDGDKQLEEQAKDDYHALQNDPQLTADQRRNLCDVWLDFLLQRFTNLNQQQILQMFTLRTREELAEAVWAKEFIAQGIEQGRDMGMTALLLRLARRRFGSLPETVEKAMEGLDYLQLEALSDAILDLADLPALEAWLRAAKS